MLHVPLCEGYHNEIYNEIIVDTTHPSFLKLFVELCNSEYVFDIFQCISKNACKLSDYGSVKTINLFNID